MPQAARDFASPGSQMPLPFLSCQMETGQPMRKMKGNHFFLAVLSGIVRSTPPTQMSVHGSKEVKSLRLSK